MSETAGPRRVLHVGSDQEFAAAAVENLERIADRLVVETVTSESDALARLAETSVDCVVADADGLGTDGLGLLDAVREEYGDLPFLLVTGTDREAIAGEALDRDVTDLVRKRSDRIGFRLLANRIGQPIECHRSASTASKADAAGGLLGTVCHVLVRSETREEIERRICETVVDVGPYASAWIGAYDPNREIVEPRADAGEAAPDREAVDVASGDGAVERAVRRRAPVAFGNAESEAGSESDANTPRECRAHIAVPLSSADQLYGVLCGVLDRPGAIGDHDRERERLAEVGTDVAAAIDRAEKRSHRRRLNRQLRSAVEHAGHVVLITDEDGHITYVNDAFEAVTGYPASEAIGCRPSILQSGEHDDAFYRDLWETISSGDVWDGEVVNERRDGSQYVINQTIGPITDDDGELTGFVAINRDITDRKKRELNLAFLKRAIDQAGVGIGTYRADGYPAYVNERLAELFGTDREELRAQHIEMLEPALDHEQGADYWDSFEDGERRIYEAEIERLDTGDLLPAEVVSSRVRIHGEPYQVNTVRDATERKRQERALDRFRSAVEHAGHSVLITDEEGRIEYVNDTFERISGYSAAEAVGRTPSLLRSGEHDDAFYRDLWETILDGDVWQGEVTNERKNGDRYLVDQTIAPITDDGEITGFVAINRDVTELKAYERELKAQNERLKGYGQAVAHDLRNPLSLLDAELTQFSATVDGVETVDGDAVRTFCETIRVTIDRMAALIDDLLAMAEQGQRVLDAEPVSLDAVAAAAWAQVDTDVAELSVQDVDVEADPDRLRELFSNLFRNSVEHGGGDVEVRVEPLDFTAGFAVEDDGPGIPEAEREDVFDRGFTTATDGTGFGLAIVEQITEAHGWTVDVTEGRAGGARFEFRFEDPT